MDSHPGGPPPSNKGVIMIHIIDLTKGKLVYYPPLQAIFKTSEIGASILEKYLNENLPLHTLAKKFNLQPGEIEKFIQRYEQHLEEIRTSIRKRKETKENKSFMEIKVHIAHKCNLRCVYCYAKDGTYGEPGMMSSETAIRTVDYYDKMFKDSVIRFAFFGGEPFLNPEAIESLCEYATELTSSNNNRFEFAAVTNGTILTKKILDILQKFFKGITVSIDGPEVVHNQLRKYSNGKSTFKKIVSNLKILNERLKKPLHYEATYTSLHEKEGISRKDVREFLKNRLGFTGGSLVDVSVSEKDDPLLPCLSDTEEGVKGIGEGNTIDGWLYYPFQHFVNRSYSRYFCGIGKAYFAVSPSGEIYPCQQFMGIESLKIGNIYEEKENDEVKKMLSIFDKEENERCKGCWAKFLCKGCPAHIYSRTGRLEIPEDICKTHKVWVERLLCKLLEVRSDTTKYKKLVENMKLQYEYSEKLT